MATRSLQAVLLMTLLLSAAFAQSRSGARSRPSLDSLYSRAGQFWSLLAQKKRLEASGFLRNLDQRNAFLARKSEPEFTDPVIKGVRFGERPDHMAIDVVVNLVAMGQTFRWSLQQEWVFEGGRWLLDEPIESDKSLFSRPITPDGNRVVISQFKEGFRFKVSELEIPPDAFGKQVDGDLEYEFATPNGLDLEVAGGPAFLSVNRLDLRNLQKTGRIRYTISGDQLVFVSGPIEPLVLRAKSGPESVEFRLPVRWNGRAPYRWTFSPAAIASDYRGEVRLEVFNQSDQPWTIGSVFSSSGTLELVRLPEKIIPPEGSGIFQFKAIGPQAELRDEGSLRDSVSLTRPSGSVLVTIPVPYQPAKR